MPKPKKTADPVFDAVVQHLQKGLSDVDISTQYDAHGLYGMGDIKIMSQGHTWPKLEINIQYVGIDGQLTVANLGRDVSGDPLLIDVRTYSLHDPACLAVLLQSILEAQNAAR